MIASVAGPVSALAPEQAVVEIGGVGLAVQCTPSTLAGLRVGQACRLSTSLVVREDSLTLYGFADDDERVVFEMLQTASGVGPRLAQAMLAVHGPDDLRRAVATEDLVALTKVSGIGRKGAQRIVLELKDRLGPPVGGGSSSTAVPAVTTRAGTRDDWRNQVHAALLGLGWSGREADDAVATVATTAEADETPEVGAMLRAALSTLSRG